MDTVTIESPNQQVLRQPAAKMSFPLSVEVREFIEEMKAYFINLEPPGVGLAAPQVGKPWQIALVYIPEEARAIRKDAYDNVPLTVIINPSYEPVAEEGKVKDWEGCFSVPDLMGEVYRYKTIRYEYYNEAGEKISAVAKGLFARVLQHEIGHLNAQLYTDIPRETDCRFGPMDEMRALRLKEIEEMKNGSL